MYFHIGRPVLATDTTSAKVWEASYLPVGGVQSSKGPNPELRLPGRWFQSETGLHQNWMRDYDPTLGRYLQADPLGLIDGASVYESRGTSPQPRTPLPGLKWSCFLGQFCGLAKMHLVSVHAVFCVSAWPKHAMSGVCLSRAV